MNTTPCNPEISDHEARPRLPQHEGSVEALAVLMAMAEWKTPVRASEIAAMADLDNHSVSRALAGLRERGRVVCTGTRRHATWQLSHTATAQEGRAS